jgi:hypothetical protein
MLCSNQLSYVADGAHYSLVAGGCVKQISENFLAFYQTLKVLRRLDGNILLKNGTLTDLQRAFTCCTETLMALSNAPTTTTTDLQMPQASPLVLRIIGAVALAHLINDLIQAVSAVDLSDAQGQI